MAIITTTTALSILSNPIKDLYKTGKDKFGDRLDKWGNSRNISSLIKKVGSYEKVKTIWQRDKEVSLTSFYYPSKVTFHTDLTKKVTSLKDLPGIGGLVIQGTVGQGKSIFLRYLCIQELRKHSSERIPVLMELRKLDSGSPLKKTLFTTLENLGFEISDDLFDFYAESGKLVLLLDGFDELTESQIIPVIRELESWAERYPKLQVIVSSRPGAEIQKSSHFTVVRLAPLANDDHRAFLSKIGVKGNQLDNLLKAVQSSPSQIKEFLSTPLLLTLLAIVYKADGVIPAELPEFFQVLFTTVFSKHDGIKPGFKRNRRTVLNDRNLEQLFESFCFAVMRRNFGVSLNEDNFNLAFQDALKFRDEKCDASSFRHDLVKVACLLIEDGFDLAFAHKSLLEYFSASFIKNSTEKQSEKIYSSIRALHQWRPVLKYANYIDKYKYYKFYCIPNINELLQQFDIKNNVFTQENTESVFNALYKSATMTVAINPETGKFRDVGLNPNGSFVSSSIYSESIFMRTIRFSLPFKDTDLKLEDLKLKFGHLSKELNNEVVDDFRIQCLDYWDKENINLIKGSIKEEFDLIINDYERMCDFVKLEDEKALEFAKFDLNS